MSGLYDPRGLQNPPPDQGTAMRGDRSGSYKPVNEMTNDQLMFDCGKAAGREEVKQELKQAQLDALPFDQWASVVHPRVVKVDCGDHYQWRAAAGESDALSEAILSGMTYEELREKAIYLMALNANQARTIDSLQADRESVPCEDCNGHGEVGDEIPQWSGWACQKPGRLPRLYGAREIAEVNLDDEETGDRLIFLKESA